MTFSPFFRICRVAVPNSVWVLMIGLPLATAFADITAGQDQNAGWVQEPFGESAVPAPVVALAPVETSPPNWAVAAMTAIDPKYTEGIVVVTAQTGTPEPREWTIIARDTSDLGTLHKLTVADGQVIADVLSLNAYESFRQDVRIDPTQVQTDSGDAFLIAQPIAAANGKIIGHVDYALTVRGKDAAPIWTLNCFDLNGGYLGKVVLLATNGDVLETPGFPQSPAN